MGSARHRRLPMRHGEIEKPVFDRTQVPPEDQAGRGELKHLRCVGDVLDGGAIIDERRRRRRQQILQDLDHPQGRVACRARRLGDAINREIAILKRGYIARGRCRDEVQLGLRLCQGDDDAEPAASPGRFVEDGVAFRRRPAMAENPGVDQVRVHGTSTLERIWTSALRTSSRDEPQGT